MAHVLCGDNSLPPLGWLGIGFIEFDSIYSLWSLDTFFTIRLQPSDMILNKFAVVSSDIVLRIPTQKSKWRLNVGFD